MNLFNYFLQKCPVLLLVGLLQQAGLDVSFSKAKLMLVLVPLEVKGYREHVTLGYTECKYKANHAIPSIIPINGTCHDTCGGVPIKFPFGSGFGCGHPHFARYIRCSSGVLQFTTGTGIYTVSSIDYSSNTILVTDPLMSTCSSMQNSGSFILDRESPFSITTDNVFVLLGCSTTSPVFDKRQDLCDTGSGSNICRGLYSCNAITGIGLVPSAPISTCCVYEPPIPLGSGYGLDLPKLQCSSYSSVIGFGGDEGNPMKWQYGIPLQFNGSYYTESCKNCEDSGGSCGFSGFNQSFACICKNGMNTTINCYGRGSCTCSTFLGFKFDA
nr:LEAF RUST 10 DISEASE-RESISTANCE LOCUS RECEPTOR-LIKE PROTEIN KINASE-like 2.7 [Coffea arabica]